MTIREYKILNIKADLFAKHQAKHEMVIRLARSPRKRNKDTEYKLAYQRHLRIFYNSTCNIPQYPKYVKNRK